MFFTRFINLAILVLVIISNVQAQTPAPYNFGTFPFMPVKRLEQFMAPIAVEIGEQIGHSMIYHSPSSYIKFMDRLEAEEFDFAHVQPFDYVRIARQHNYVPIFGRYEHLYAKIVTREDSKLTKLTDLKGKTLALPPKVAAISYLTLNTLIEAGFDLTKDITIVYTKSHPSCLQKVLTRQADACGTPPPAYRVFTNKRNIKFYEITRSQEIPHSLFIAHKRIPLQERQMIIKGMLESRLLKVPSNLRHFFIHNENTSLPFRPVKDSEYDGVANYWKRVQDLNLQ